MANFTDVICRIYSSWVNDICHIKIIFFTFKFSHGFWINHLLQITLTQSGPCFASFKNVFTIEQLLFKTIFVINFFSFCTDVLSIDISIVLFHFLFIFLIILFVPIYTIIAIYKKALTFSLPHK